MDLSRLRAENPQLLKSNLLALVLNFEKYWQSYSLSDGILYAFEVREEAKKIVRLFYVLYGKKARATSKGSKKEVVDPFVRHFIEEIDKWLDSREKFPRVISKKEYTNRLPFIYQDLFISLESQLQKEIGLPIGLLLSATLHEEYFRRKQMKWAGQIPDDLVGKALDPSFLERMSTSDTLVMVADIRRSQDLITYGLSPDFYREQILGFLDSVREILRDDYGIYDRFTGDGFIAYFNQFVCDQEGKDYYEMILDACKRIQSFAGAYFEKWSNQIRRIPVEPIGLSLGIDSGRVSYKEIEGQFFAIGDACVWATRMCNAGKRGDIVFNNIPYHKIAPFGKGAFSEEIESVSKNGESFKAYRIDPSLVTYQSQPQKDPSLDKPTAIK